MKISFSLKITLLAVLFNVLFGLSFGFLFHLNELPFTLIDAKGYLAVGQWMIGVGNEFPVEYIILRPYLFPVICAFSFQAGGAIGLWLTQLTFWSLTLFFILKSLELLNTGRKWQKISAAVYVLNVSGLLISYHALTEPLTSFLLALLTYCAIKLIQEVKLKYWGSLILIAVLLTLTKPLFQILLVILAISAVVHHLLVRKIPRPQPIVMVVIASILLFTQLRIMHEVSGQYTISQIGDITLKDYYFTKTVSNHEDIPLEEARKLSKEWTMEEFRSYMQDHPSSSMYTFFRLIEHNIAARSSFAYIPERIGFLTQSSKVLNSILLITHIIFLILSTWMIYYNWKTKKISSIIPLLFIGLPLYLILFSSGITFEQGDRVVLPASPLWIVMYSYVVILIQIRKQELPS